MTDAPEEIWAYIEMQEAFAHSDEGVAAWLYGFLSAFEPVDSEEIGDEPGTAKARYDTALAMLRRLACFDEVGDDVVPDWRLPAQGMSKLWKATRVAISSGGWHAKASAPALLADLLLNSEDDGDE